MTIKKTVSSVSKWKKDGKELAIRGKRIDPEEKTTFTFSGWNPFPCFSMVSTYHIIKKWLEENGWEKLPGGWITRKTETRTTELDENDTPTIIIRSDIDTYEYIPVKD